MLTALLVLIALTLAALLLVGWLAYRQLGSMTEALVENTEEVKQLRLVSRTRVSEAVMRSGEVSLERQLTRLGRASAARRVVVGGDDTSELNEGLRRQSRVGRLAGGEDDND